MKNINQNSVNYEKPILIKDAIHLIIHCLEMSQARIESRIFSAFEDELLLILHRRNILTINKVGANELVMLILNLAKKNGNEIIPISKALCQSIFKIAANMGIIDADKNPSTFLDVVFPNKPTVIIGDYDF